MLLAKGKALGALCLEKDFGCFHLGKRCAFSLGKVFWFSLLREILWLFPLRVKF